MTFKNGHDPPKGFKLPLMTLKDHWKEIDRFFNYHLTTAVKWVLYINVGVFLAFHIPLLIFKLQTPFIVLFSEIPACLIGRYFIWQTVTYMFIHVDPWHLLFNLLGLWFFAPRLESRWGTRIFWRFFFFTGIGAGLFYAILAVFSGRAESIAPMIGMSGAIFGILVAFAYYYPDDIIFIWGVFPMKAKYVVLLFGFLEFTASLGASVGDHIAHNAHLGGLLFGFIFVKYFNFFANWPRKGRLPDDWGGGGRWRDL
ncbi:MAG: rhomboid family intramembrane serine protease [bacterium]